MQVVTKAASEFDTPATDFYLVNAGLSFRNSLSIAEPQMPFLEGTEKAKIRVPTLALDTFCRTENIHPNVIKIDVEGAELLVLRGARGLLTSHHPAIVLSVHPYWLPRSHSVEHIFEFMSSCGYEVKQKHEIDMDPYTVGDYLFGKS